MTPLALLFFAAFAAVLVCSYLAIRRGWARLPVISAVCVFASIVTMTLGLLGLAGEAANEIMGDIVLRGVIFGGMGALGILVMAWYFQTNERRTQYHSASLNEE